jgi:hypothetical protein
LIIFYAVITATYTEIVSGTPKLSLVFKLSEEFKVNQDLLVTLGVQNWKSIIDDIRLFTEFQTRLNDFNLV